MASVLCPRCKRKTEKLEMFGACEWCGHSAMDESGIQVEGGSLPDSRGRSSSSCVICGAGGTLQPFFLRTFSVNNFFGRVTRKWRDCPCQCCEACYRNVAWLQRGKLLFTLLSCAGMLATPLLVVAGMKRQLPLL